MLTVEHVTKIASHVLAPLYKLLPDLENAFTPKFDRVSDDEICFWFRGWYFQCHQSNPNRWTAQGTTWLTKKGRPDKRTSCNLRPMNRNDVFILKSNHYDTAYFCSLADALRACVLYSFKMRESNNDVFNDRDLYWALERQRLQIVRQVICPHFTEDYFSTFSELSESIISKWLSLAEEPEKLVVQQTETKIVVRCGDCLQASRLSHQLDLLVKTGLKFVEIYVGKSVYNNIALERLLENPPCNFIESRPTWIESLLLVHREILEAGGIAIDEDKIRLYCHSKEEAIALYDGRWDLCERAEEQQLPQQFELYYFSDGPEPHLYRKFSIREGQIVKRLMHREIAKTFQKQDITDNP